jgi:D-alanyl-D-alanine carboxypeptidase
MRRFALVCFSLLMAATLLAAAPAEARRYSSIVVDAESGVWLHADHPEVKCYPASLTKIMTLYLVFDALEAGEIKLSDRWKVSAHAASMPPSKLGLRAGETISVETAILGLVTKSANDAAVVVAEALGGTERKFAHKMTRRARDLGLDHTTFRNASGLPNSRQVTTARDMVRLALAMLKNHPKYYEYFSTPNFSYKGRRYRNHNSLLRTYRGADGIKTGYIRASGFNLVASAVRKGRRLVAVVMGGKTARARDKHMALLLDRAFKKAGPASAKRTQQVQAVPPPDPKPDSLGVEDADGQLANLAANVRRIADGEPIAPAPELSPIDMTDAEPGFAVQVGAYARYDGAKAAAGEAKQQLPRRFNDAKVVVTQLKHRDSTLYRARLIGLSRSKANEACKVLVKKGLDCLVVVETVTLAHNPAQ